MQDLCSTDPTQEKMCYIVQNTRLSLGNMSYQIIQTRNISAEKDLDHRSVEMIYPMCAVLPTSKQKKTRQGRQQRHNDVCYIARAGRHPFNFTAAPACTGSNRLELVQVLQRDIILVQR